MTLAPLALLQRIDAWFFSAVPAARIAWVRFGVGAYAFVYLVARAGHLNSVARFPAEAFVPVGLASVLDEPLAPFAVHTAYAATVALAAAFTLGLGYRFTAPAFALLLTWVLGYRHSFGMIFHTDNLLVLHVACLSLAGAAASPLPWPRRVMTSAARAETRSGWVLRVCCMLTVASYVVAAVAKLRITGFEWALGDVLREHVAYDAIRKIELGSIYSPIGTWLVPHGWLFPPLAAFSLATELAAPLALLNVRAAAVWCIAAWLFHAGVLALMAIAFPYPLSGCAFLAFFPIERWVLRAFARVRAPAGAGA
jgi:hypothetical protein